MDFINSMKRIQKKFHLPKKREKTSVFISDKYDKKHILKCYNYFDLILMKLILAHLLSIKFQTKEYSLKI